MTTYLCPDCRERVEWRGVDAVVAKTDHSCKKPVKQPVDRKQEEEELLNQVIVLARTLGWKVAHFRPGLTQSGNWRTQCQADAKGFPDLVLVRTARGGHEPAVIYAELKSEKGKLSDDQFAWLSDLAQAGQTTYVWRPSDMPEIERILRSNRRR